MKRLCGVVVLGLLANICCGAADYNVIKDIVGTYPILEQNGVVGVVGKLTISADDNGVGIATVPTAMASRPSKTLKVITGKETTSLTKVADGIAQNFINNSNTTRIDYKIFDGYLTIHSEQCTENEACQKDDFVVSSGKSNGELQDTKLFLLSLKGLYKIDLAGGVKPKTGDDEAAADPTLDPSELSLFTPYCPPGGGVCFDGYHPFRYDQTVVYRKALGDHHDLYQLITGKAPKLSYFHWELDNGKISFRDLQFSSDGKPVCLEHEMTKKAEEDEE